MFSIPQPTPFDLQFQLFRIPIRVSIWFWVIGTFLGYPLLQEGLPEILVWLLAMFISILVHELGHALTAKFFGFPPEIILHSFGGLARYYPLGKNNTYFNSILITLAGPLAGLALFALSMVVSFAVFSTPALFSLFGEQELHLFSQFMSQMIFINLVWSILNLTPVLPLDGGRICSDVISIFKPQSGIWITVRIGIVISALVAIFFFTSGNTYSSVMFAMLCFSNIQMLQQRDFYN